MHESDDEVGAGQSAPSRSADGEIEYNYSDYPDRNDDEVGEDLGATELYGDEYHDEEYEWASSEAPPSPDRSAFPDTRSPSPATTPAQAAERVAADAQIAQIAGDLVEMYESSGGAQLHVPASSAPSSTFGTELDEHTLSSLYGSGAGVTSADVTVQAEEGELVEPEAEQPSASLPAAAEQSSIDAETFAPRLDPPLDPHHAFIRSADFGPTVQHVGNIEYELAQPVRSSSPPRFERPATVHNVDSPVTSADEQEDYRQIDNGMVRVGVDEEEMLDSTFVGRDRPLGPAADASGEARHEQDDVETTAEPQKGLLIIDDDENMGDDQNVGNMGVIERTDELTSNGSAPQTTHRQYGATPPPATTAEGQEVLPIVGGVAPPVNLDIVPEPVQTLSEQAPANVGRAVIGAALPLDAPSHAVERDAHSDEAAAGGPIQPFELDAPRDTASLSHTSSHLNRAPASEFATSDTRVPYAVPPTAHRKDSPLEEGEVAEDDEMVRVGVMPDEMRDAALFEEARPLATAVDASKVARVEQQDTQAAPLAPNALVVIDDDDEEDVTQGGPGNITLQDPAMSVTAETISRASPPVADTTTSAASDDGHVSNRVESFPAGVAPPKNPSILPDNSVSDAPMTTSADYVALESEDEDDEDVETEDAFEPIADSAGHDVEHAILGLDADETVQPVYEAPTLPGESESEDQDRRVAQVPASPSEPVSAEVEEDQTTGPDADGQGRPAEKPSEQQRSSSGDPILSGDPSDSDSGGVSGDAGADTDRSAALATVQVIIEVDTDAEGDKPTEVRDLCQSFFGPLLTRCFPGRVSAWEQHCR